MNLSLQKKTLLYASDKASKILTHYFDKKPKIKEKSNMSFVTEADLKANGAIIREIKKSFPEHSIISEETPEEKNNSDFTWVIDPLDETHNFIHGIPVFGTSIALKHKKEIVLGAIYMPALGIKLTCEKGKGTFVNGKKVSVSKNSLIHHSFVLFELSFDGRSRKLKAFGRMVNERFDIRNLGCAVYHLYLVAAGLADVYIAYHSNEWDVAAGFLAVEEAGGRITNTKGKKAYSDSGNYIFSNSAIHKNFMKFV